MKYGFDQKKDYEFFEKLTENIWLLKKLARKYIRNEEDGKDLVQDTIYKAIKNRDKYKDNTNIKGWLTRILQNTFINQYHKEKDGKNMVSFESLNMYDENDYDPVINKFTHPFDRSIKYEFSDCFNLTLNKLEEQNQLLIFMRDIEGYSYKQIAGYLNIPVGTVRTRLYRSRKDMKLKYREINKDDNL